MIEGVKIKKLKVIPDERGRLMEILRKDDELFKEFGQVYMTTVRPGVVKAWHYHKKQTDNIAVLKGMLKLVLYKKGFDVEEIFLGEHNPLLIQIPVDVFHGFKGIGREETIVMNCPTLPYVYDDPDEYRFPFDTQDIPYEWDVKFY